MIKIKVQTKEMVVKSYVIELDVDSFRDIEDDRMSLIESDELIEEALLEQTDASWDSFKVIDEVKG